MTFDIAPCPDPRRRALLRRAWFGVVGACVATVAMPARAEELFRYRGREYAPTGTNVTRRLSWTSKLPFDASYADLTPAQVAEIRDQYNDLAKNEEPPYPKGGLRSIFRIVDESLDASTPRLTPGPLVVVAKIRENGETESVAVYKTPHAFVSSAVTRALVRTDFKPATRDGKPVPMDFLLSVELTS